MTTDLTLYFGPNNDPGDSSGTHHWQYPHDPDFHNPAFTITRVGNNLSIAFAVRNRDTVVHRLDVVNLYAAACGILASATDVNTLASMVISAGVTINSWSALSVPPPDVPPINSVADTFWSPPATAWTIPAFANGFIVIATLQCAATGQAPHADYASDPSVGIWLG